MMQTNNKNANLIVVDTPEETCNRFIEIWKQTAQTAITERGIFCVALSGGSTPITFYKALAQTNEKLPWKKTHVFLVDERGVEESHPQSNMRMLRNALLSHIPIPADNIHPFITTIDMTQNIKQYATTLRTIVPCVQAIPAFDFILLGIGEDGHTASLFPKASNWHTKDMLTIQTQKSSDPFPRLSLTLQTINNARHIIFLVTGIKKASIVSRIWKNDTVFPASHVAPTAGSLIFLLDTSAASLL